MKKDEIKGSYTNCLKPCLYITFSVCSAFKSRLGLEMIQKLLQNEQEPSEQRCGFRNTNTRVRKYTERGSDVDEGL